MGITAHDSTKRTIALIILGLLMVLIISITGTTYLIFTNRSLIQEQKHLVTPMISGAPYSVSQTTADAEYYRLMTLSFLALRLNVTPETVDSNHRLLKSFIKPTSRDAFDKVLSAEAGRIKRSDVTSTFYQNDITVYPVDGRVDVAGMLKTWVGNDKPITELKSYRLTLRYDAGATSIEQFVEVKKNED